MYQLSSRWLMPTFLKILLPFVIQIALQSCEWIRSFVTASTLYFNHKECQCRVCSGELFKKQNFLLWLSDSAWYWVWKISLININLLRIGMFFSFWNDQKQEHWGEVLYLLVLELNRVSFAKQAFLNTYGNRSF